MRFGWLLLAGLAAVGCSDGSNGDGGGSDISNLQRLAEEYPTVDAQRTKETLDLLTVEEHWTMELVEMGGAFKLAVFLKACQVDPDLRWHQLVDGKPYNCALAQYEWNETVQLIASTGIGTMEENVESGRLSVIIYEKCRTGQIDKQTCNVYYGVQQQVGQAAAQTNEVIVDNIGNKCRVGRDPGCYP